MRDETDIGYERVLSYLRECQKAAPKGVSIKCTTRGKSKYLSLQIKLGNRRVEKSLNLNCTMLGITAALDKARQVAEALKTIASESDFNVWYDKNILHTNYIRNDLVTFGEAIAQVEQAYWDGTDKKRNQRDRNNVSQRATWQVVYGRFYALLPSDKLLNPDDLLKAITSKERGTKVYGDCLYAFKRLSNTVNHTASIYALDAISHTQTKFRELQNAELDTFLAWMKDCQASAGERYLLRRKEWLWVFSMQLLYGLRVHEVFAIANLTGPIVTKDGVTIPALDDPINTKMIAVVGEMTALGTTTKTGYRLAAPMLPPSHPNLIDELDIRDGFPPMLVITSTDPMVICSKYNHAARAALKRWKAPITQTHALRHLCNQNGKQAGISAEDRAANLGHSLQMNTSTYLKREATNTRLAAIDAMHGRMLPLEGAIAVLKRIGVTESGIALTAEIYGVSVEKVRRMIE